MCKWLLPAVGIALALCGVVRADSPDETADKLAAQMTQAEKISLIAGGPGGYSTVEIKRLNIPSFWMSDGPQGVRNPPTAGQRGCAFPSGAALAATWDVDLATAYGKALGLEDRARGVYFQLGPGVNICRVPVNGRNFEYFGEDPCLSAAIAANWVKACSAQGAIPTVKHFAGNNQETDRNSVDARIDVRTLNEIYLPAFKAAVTSGANVAVMCSYNRLNDAYASNNDWLLNQTLKQQWNFPGLVMSDWGASHDTTDLAHGLDLEMPRAIDFAPAKITDALAKGAIKQSDLDGAVHRILRSAAAEGWLNPGWKQTDSSLPLDSPASAKTSLDIARAGIVLLKNENNLLPLDRWATKSIVVIGPNATAPSGQAPLNIGGGGSGAVTPFASHFAEAEYLKGITAAAGPGVVVTYLPMPDFDDSAYKTLALSHTSADGPAGLTLTIQPANKNAATPSALVQESINLTWSRGQLPFGLPPNTDATFTWSGVLQSPTAGDWQLHTAGGPTVTVDGKEVSDNAIVHLDAIQASPITVTLAAKANPPAPRGRRGGRRGPAGGAPMVKVAFTEPLIPDLSQAKSADAVVVCVGLNRTVESEGFDRPFDLPDIQNYLIAQSALANSRTIVINNSGAAVAIAPWLDSAGAVLQAWYLGQEGGTAIGQTLFGDNNPSGRLCSTFDRAFDDNPAFAYYPGQMDAALGYRVEPYTEGIFYGYRGYDKSGKAPLFPFGFGLSYTTFGFSNLHAAKSADGAEVTVDVKNTGKRQGAEVVQIYVGEADCPLPRPVRELKGFTKVSLDPGQSKTVKIPLLKEAFEYWDPGKSDWTMDAGHSFTISAGESERDIKASETITF